MSTGNLGITYGPLRLAVAEMFQIDPADVTGAHVAEYEAMQESEQETHE